MKLFLLVLVCVLSSAETWNTFEPDEDAILASDIPETPGKASFRTPFLSHSWVTLPRLGPCLRDFWMTLQPPESWYMDLEDCSLILYSLSKEIWKFDDYLGNLEKLNEGTCPEQEVCFDTGPILTVETFNS